MILNDELYNKLGKTFEDASQKAKIPCKCDYCGALFERLKHNILRSWQHTKNDSCSDAKCVQKKRIESNLILFGTDSVFKNKEIRDRIAQTNLEKYGVVNPAQNKEIKAKQEETCRLKYGASNPFQSDIIKSKIAQTNLKKYGVVNPTQNKEIKTRQQQTLFERYGVNYALQNESLRKKAMETCLSNFGKFPANNYGKVQNELKEWLNSFGFNFKSNLEVLVGQEIDLYDDIKKLGIEYCGLRWHNEFSPAPRDRNYHRLKYDKCLEKGVQLLTIFSDEWLKREYQCKGHIKSILGINEQKIFARKCNVVEISKDQGKTFFETYHIQGQNTLGIVFFGIFFNEELCGVMSLGRHNRKNKNIILDRLCFKQDIQIIGGASKLFKYCINWASDNKYSKIISFSDNRWSLGRVYEILGFKLDKEYKTDYSYVSLKNSDQRLSKQSQKKSNTNCPKDKTEFEWACEQGLARIWDCGKKRWIYEL